MKIAKVIVCLAVTFLNGSGTTQSAQPDAVSLTAGTSTKLILEKDEGEQRVRRPREVPLPSTQFTIKFDRKNGGSQQMFLGTESVPPGAAIPRHKHLRQDEILLIRTSSARVWLGDQQRDVHAGAVVFIPSGTWISLKNTGNEELDLAFIFSAPGFEDYLRCTSVAVGEPTTRMTNEQWEQCQNQGHVHFEGVQQPGIRK